MFCLCAGDVNELVYRPGKRADGNGVGAGGLNRAGEFGRPRERERHESIGVTQAAGGGVAGRISWSLPGQRDDTGEVAGANCQDNLE